MLILGTFHKHGMKIHVASKGVGYDEKYEDSEAWSFIAMTRDCLN